MPDSEIENQEVIYVEQSLNDAHELLKAFLKSMPEITVDPSHPEVQSADLSMGAHAYIAESFGNYLESLPTAEDVIEDEDPNNLGHIIVSDIRQVLEEAGIQIGHRDDFISDDDVVNSSTLFDRVKSHSGEYMAWDLADKESGLMLSAETLGSVAALALSKVINEPDLNSPGWASADPDQEAARLKRNDAERKTLINSVVDQNIPNPEDLAFLEKSGLKTGSREEFLSDGAFHEALMERVEDEYNYLVWDPANRATGFLLSAETPYWAAADAVNKIMEGFTPSDNPDSEADIRSPR